MKSPINSGIKFKDKIVKRYIAIDSTDIPTDYDKRPIDYRKDEVEKYDVVFWHRLLRSLYYEPSEIECEIQTFSHDGQPNIQIASFRKTQEKNNWGVIGIDETLASEIEAGKIKPFPVNWRYLIRLPSGGIVELGTKDKTTIFYIAQVILFEKNENNYREEANKFINIILDEANRLRGQLFKPTEEFKKQEDLRLYLLFNVYMSNYQSANTMLSIAESQEADLREQFLRYDARTSDLYDQEKNKHIDQHMLTCGMFFCSAISYFFMALEGFINLVYHAFLKKEFRDKKIRTEQRLDLEQKLRFMPSLCKGFTEDSDVSSTILEGFGTLKKYRNSLFHSKVEDSLKSLCFIEDGFLYNYDMDAHKDRFLSSHKIKLTLQDVVEVKTIVDEIVNSILGSMNQDTRMATETYILKEPNIPFFVLETGELAIGKREAVMHKELSVRQKALQKYVVERECIGSIFPLAPYNWYELKETLPIKWMAYRQFLQEHAHELANTINEFRQHIVSLLAWEKVLKGLAEEERHHIVIEFVSPLATLALNMPYVIRSRFFYSVAHLSHQANQLKQKPWVDDLPIDKKIYCGEADKYGKPWKKKYTKLKVALEKIANTEYKKATHNFRNKYNHRYSPSIELGLTELVTRTVKVKDNKVSGLDHRFGHSSLFYSYESQKKQKIQIFWYCSNFSMTPAGRNDDHGQVSYKFGQTDPLMLKDIIPLLETRHSLCLSAFKKYQALINEQVTEINNA